MENNGYQNNGFQGNQNNQNNQYNQNNNYVVEQSETITVGQWVITFLLCAIPFVNIIMVCIWSFGGNTPLSKRNWARAALIMMGIGIIFSILFSSILISAIIGAASRGGY